MKFFEIFKKKVKQRIINLDKLPQHIAIIMDGNGRWANRRGLPRTAGHRVGMERVQDAVNVCLEYGISYITLYAFSTENWKRPSEEVNYLMNLFEYALEKEMDKLAKKKVRVCFIGLRDNLRPSLVQLMERTEALTADNEMLTLNLAINYGGRSEIVAATKGVIQAVQRGELEPEQLDEANFANYLFTAGQPDPDLLIKPGGETRISNFLLWQMAYTELYFCKKYWPDFGCDELEVAIAFFSRKKRRFGGIK